MLIAFILLWALVLAMNYTFALRTKTDSKFSNALKAMIIIPMATLGYVLHPILMDINKNLMAVLMMAAMSLFAFLNLRLIAVLRN